MKNIVLTGATSMIGIALIKECISCSIEVIAIVRRNSSNKQRIPDHSLVSIYECDLDELCSFDISNIITSIDCFYHIGWAYTDIESRTSSEKQIRNIQYTLDAVKLAKKLGCKKFIGAGSQAEYGLKEIPLNGYTNCDPITAYGIAKYSAGKLARILAEEMNLNFNWVRILSVYGRNDRENTLLSSFIKKCTNNEPFPLSSCTQIWDYLHEKDAGRAFLLIGEKGITNRFYSLGSGIGLPLRDYLDNICKIINSDYRLKFGQLETNLASPQFLVADIKELMADTSWKPEVSFKEGINDLIAFYHNAKVDARG